MKTKLLLPFLTALVLTGCSNDDAPDNNGGGSANGETSYLAVNIVTPKDVMGRATTEGGFEYGTDDENAASSATFILLDNNNKVFQVSKNVALTLETTNTGTPVTNVERISSAIIVVDGVNEKPDIKGILAILNAPSSLDFAKGTDLSTITATLDNYATEESTSAGKFIMSNSVYINDADNITIAEAITKDAFQTTEDLAKKNSINIHVERVVAKVKTKAVTNITDAQFNQGAQVELFEDATKNLTIDIKGIQIANCATKSYLFKDINGLDTDANAPWTGWNEATNKRCYWAAKTYASNPVASSDFNNNSWYAISGKDNTGTDITTGDGVVKLLTAPHSFYVQENINQTYKTSVIVTAQLKDGDQPFELVRIGGLYFTLENGLKHIASILAGHSYKVKIGNEPIKDFDYECIAWKSEPLTGKKAWTGYAQIKTDLETTAKFYIYDASYTQDANHLKPCTLDDMNNVLKEPQYLALYWKNGMCYYYAEIEHFGNKTTEDGKEVKRNGIIRNHIYDITLNKIYGLGVPVIKPEEPIIPERPDDDETLFYLAAKVNILSWKVVSQGVDLH